MKRKTLPALLLATLALIVIFMLGNNKDPYVAVVDGHRIGLSEYYVYLYEQKLLFESRGGADIWDMDFDGEPSDEVAKQNALSSVELVKVSVAQAKRMGLSLTSSELSDAAEYASQVHEQIEPLAERLGITKELLTAIMEENDLYRKLFDKITADYVHIDGFDMEEKKFEMYLSEYNKWSANITTTRNEPVWNRISVRDLER